jgi:hypothetical protein
MMESGFVSGILLRIVLSQRLINFLNSHIYFLPDNFLRNYISRIFFCYFFSLLRRMIYLR